jgi:DNA end-binding protein Ku
VPKTIWRGWVSFGLVSIPVRLYRAVEEKAVRFREVDRRTGRRVRHRRVVETDGAPSHEETQEPWDASTHQGDASRDEDPGPARVEDQEIGYDEVVKGYDLPSGETVAISREELESIEPERTRTIDVTEFVELADIDPLFFDRAYLVVPDDEPTAQRAYDLLRRAMEETGRVAIGSFVLRTREHLAAIRPMQEGLGLFTLHYADEIRSLADLGYVAPSADASPREVRLAKELIGAMATTWDPSRHRDEYRARVLELIERKAASEAFVPPPEAGTALTEPVDLMAALKASVEAIGKKKQPSRRRRTA